MCTSVSVEAGKCGAEAPRVRVPVWRGAGPSLSSAPRPPFS